MGMGEARVGRNVITHTGECVSKDKIITLPVYAPSVAPGGLADVIILPLHASPCPCSLPVIASPFLSLIYGNTAVYMSLWVDMGQTGLYFL
jgi:hypothetical protein